jgi:hypothetical protein
MKRGSPDDNISIYRQVPVDDDRFDHYHGKRQNGNQTVVKAVNHREVKIAERKKQIEQRNQKKAEAKKRKFDDPQTVDHKTKVDLTLNELFKIFHNHVYVTKMQVTQWLNESETVVGDALKQITMYHSTGEHKHHYSLKDEHKLNVKKAKVEKDTDEIEFESE